MLPINSPVQALTISPEALEVANCYLQTQSISKVAEELNIAPEIVSDYLDKREVKAYIDNVFMDMGFNSRFRMRSLMDTIIQKKLEEMDEAEIGSSKDIADLLALSHKMTMETLDKQIQLEKARGTRVQTQVNMQVNEFGGENTKYGNLISRLLGNND